MDVGGFGVGSDMEFGASARLDWKPVRHFGLTAGYSESHKCPQRCPRLKPADPEGD